VSPVLGVAHTGITVRDLDASVAFWVGALDARVERRFELGGTFAADVTGVPGARIEAAVVLVGTHRLELLQYLAPEHREHLRPRPHDLGMWHLALDVADLDQVAARCAEHGWGLRGAVATMADGPRAGTRFAYLEDRDGAVLELVEAA